MERGEGQVGVVEEEGQKMKGRKERRGKEKEGREKIRN